MKNIETTKRPFWMTILTLFLLAVGGLGLIVALRLCLVFYPILFTTRSPVADFSWYAAVGGPAILLAILIAAISAIVLFIAARIWFPRE